MDEVEETEDLGVLSTELNDDFPFEDDEDNDDPDKDK
jgi:hypothetical protein